MPEEEPPPTPPEDDSEYEAIDELGRGGMGVVYKAYQKRLDRHVALKVMTRDAAADPTFAERFRREAKAMARLDHPNIVSVYDYGETDEGMLFLTMEYIEGTTLGQVLESEGTLDPTWAVTCAIQICEGLNFAHLNHTVHRDIKPGNILVSLEGQIKILDFGLAKLVGAAKTDVSLTATNMAMGTPDYISPEQLEQSATVDHRADIYSLGVMLYGMFTGKLPRGAFYAPTEVRPGLDPRIDDLVLRAMQSRPEDRFQSIQEMLTILYEIEANPQFSSEPVADAPPPAPTPTSDSEPAHHRKHVSAKGQVALMKAREKRRALITNTILFGGCALVLLAIGAYYYLQPKAPDNHLADATITPGPSMDSVEEENVPAPTEPEPEPEPAPEPAPAPAPKKKEDPAPKVAAEPSKPETPPANIELTDERFLAANATFLEKLASEIEDPFSEKMDALRAKYDGALERELKTAATKADPGLITWIENERAHLAGGHSNLEAPGEKLPKNLRNMQEAYLEQRLALYTERKKAGKALLAATDTALEKLQLALTTEDKLDEALLLKNHRESLTLAFAKNYPAPQALAEAFAPPTFDINLPAPPIGPITFTPTRASKDLTPEEFAAPRFGQSIRNRIDMDLMGIEPGRFLMGSPADEAGRAGDAETQHEVTLTHGFWLSKTEVTRAQWQEYMENERVTGVSDNTEPRDLSYPIVHIRPHRARKFCELLTAAERRRRAIPPGFQYRLPTEAQWQYACRAGTTGPLYGLEADIAWPAASLKSSPIHHPVGRKKANRWGLHDMIGNVPELCNDPPGVHSPEAAINPHDPDFLYNFDFDFTDPSLALGTEMRAASRLRGTYGPKSDGSWQSCIGFRVALVPNQSIPPDITSIIPEVLERFAKEDYSGARDPILEILAVAEKESFPDLHRRATTLRQIALTSSPRPAGRAKFPGQSRLSPESGHRYLLVDIPLPWEQARDFAETFGAHLATFTSEVERDFIKQNYGAANSPFWLGAEGRRTFKWVTGEPWEFETWRPDQPDRVQEKARRFGVYCAPLEEYLWGDLDTEVSLPFLIEWDAE